MRISVNVGSDLLEYIPKLPMDSIRKIIVYEGNIQDPIIQDAFFYK